MSRPASGSRVQHPGAQRRRQRLRTLAALLHPGPSLATVLAGLAFARLLAGARASPRAARTWLLGVMLAAQQAAISLHNDWCDRELDTQSKPWRAIPAGHVAPRHVRRAAWLLAAISLASAGWIGRREVALDAAGLAAGCAYNAGLKGTRLSWLPFASAFPLLPLFGAAAFDAWPRRWWALFLAGAPAAVAIHLADAIPDIEGDRAAGARGLASALGAATARSIAAGLVLVSATVAGIAGTRARSRRAQTGALAGALLALLGRLRPEWHRAAVTAGAAAGAFGCVAALARRR